MTELEKRNEFIMSLADAEEMIVDATQRIGLTPVGHAKRVISGLEKNIQLARLEESFMKDNPYIKNIYVEDWKIANAVLSNDEYFKAYFLYPYIVMDRDKTTLTSTSSFCYFTKDMYLPNLKVLPDNKWMCVEPLEMKTFESFIEEAHGNILLMGCGLGYVAYMLSLKEDVNEITIIELDPAIKRMFETYLKPQMNSKINIYAGDALEVLENENLSMYDYCSVDIWHNVTDMLPLYLKCLLLEEKHPNTKFHYWLEEHMHSVLTTASILLLKFSVENGYEHPNEKNLNSILTEQKLDTTEDVKEYILAPKRKILKNWAVKHPDLIDKWENNR